MKYLQPDTDNYFKLYSPLFWKMSNTLHRDIYDQVYHALKKQLSMKLEIDLNLKMYLQ
jgi:hypothetical protein